MTIDRIFDAMQAEDGNNPFDTASSAAAIDGILARVEVKDSDVAVDLMNAIVEERRRAFRLGYKTACSLLAEGLTREDG